MVHNKPHSEATKRKIAAGVTGKKNGMYKDGRRSYRTVAKASGAKTFVHNKDHDRTNNKASNLIKMSETQHKSLHMKDTNKKGITGRKKK